MLLIDHAGSTFIFQMNASWGEVHEAQLSPAWFFSRVALTMIFYLLRKIRQLLAAKLLNGLLAMFLVTTQVIACWRGRPHQMAVTITYTRSSFIPMTCRGTLLHADTGQGQWGKSVGVLYPKVQGIRIHCPYFISTLPNAIDNFYQYLLSTATTMVCASHEAAEGRTSQWQLGSTQDQELDCHHVI